MYDLTGGARRRQRLRPAPPRPQTNLARPPLKLGPEWFEE